MPSRLIREGILDSEAVLSLPVEARWLYVSILLSADDVGLFEATPFRLARRADVRREHAEKLVGLLVDLDLVRLYRHGTKQLGYIPKYGQRLQIKRLRHPAPPASLYADDPITINQINDLTSNSTVDYGDSPLTTVAHRNPRPEPEPEVEEELKISVGAKAPTSATGLPPGTAVCPYELIVKSFHDNAPSLPSLRLMDDGRRRAMRSLWVWVLTSKRTEGTRRAETADEALKWIGKYFARAESIDWMAGRASREGKHSSWKAKFDWLLTKAGMRHVIESEEESA